jgi:hypothetical protein
MIRSLFAIQLLYKLMEGGILARLRSPARGLIEYSLIWMLLFLFLISGQRPMVVQWRRADLKLS